MLSCDLSTVTVFCDGLPMGACERTTGIRYFDQVPLCPEHAPAARTTTEGER